MSEAFIIDAVRTPIGRFSGAYSGLRADDLAAIPIKALLERNSSIKASEIEDVILGCANQAGEDNRNVARFAALLAGLSPSVPGVTLNRLCASGLSSVVQAAHGIKLGEGELFIAGGIEHMTRAPYVVSKASAGYARNQEFFDTTMGWRFINPVFEAAWGVDGMGQTAENVADEFGISREDQDKFALWSQQKAAAAVRDKRFAVETVAVEVPIGKGKSRIIDTDEFPRPDSTLEGLAGLKTVFKREGGTVTAGSSSGINDGACALLLASERAVKDYKLTPRAKVRSHAVVGVEPRIMGIGPVGAIRKALKRENLTLDQIDVIELNEAFAAQSLACIRELGLDDKDPRINPNGGAIALGHPLGMSGARLAATAVYELEKRQARYALCALCVGAGQGVACILERAD